MNHLSFNWIELIECATRAEPRGDGRARVLEALGCPMLIIGRGVYVTRKLNTREKEILGLSRVSLLSLSLLSLFIAPPSPYVQPVAGVLVIRSTLLQHVPPPSRPLTRTCTGQCLSCQFCQSGSPP